MVGPVGDVVDPEHHVLGRGRERRAVRGGRVVLAGRAVADIAVHDPEAFGAIAEAAKAAAEAAAAEGAAAEGAAEAPEAEAAETASDANEEGGN